MADHFASDIFFSVSDILAVKNNPALVHVKASCDGIEKSRLSGAVTANDSGKVSGRKRQAYIVQRFFFIHSAGIKGFGYGFNE